MRIVIPGGTGQVGTLLARAMTDTGHDVTVLTRASNPRPAPWKALPWDGRTIGDLCRRWRALHGRTPPARAALST